MAEFVRDDMTLQENDLVLVQLDSNFGTVKDWVIGRTMMNEIVVPIQSYKVIHPSNSFWYNDLIDRDSDRVCQVKRTVDAYKEFALITLNDSYR